MMNERRQIDPNSVMTPQQAIAQYQACRAKADTLEQIDVTRQEFIKLLIGRGECPDKAEQMAGIAEALGSHVMIGDKMVGIKKDD